MHNLVMCSRLESISDENADQLTQHFLSAVRACPSNPTERNAKVVELLLRTYQKAVANENLKKWLKSVTRKLGVSDLVGMAALQALRNLQKRKETAVAEHGMELEAAIICLTTYMGDVKGELKTQCVRILQLQRDQSTLEQQNVNLQQQNQNLRQRNQALGQTNQNLQNQTTALQTQVNASQTHLNTCQAELANAVAALDQWKRCVVCLVRDRCIAPTPCYHLSYCETCYRDAARRGTSAHCPICNLPARNHRKIYRLFLSKPHVRLSQE